MGDSSDAAASRHRRLASLIEAACRAEARAPKPGNVHPAAAFEDLTYDDFVAAAIASAGPLSEGTVGERVEAAVAASHAATGTNVNLGIALLIGVLAAVPDGEWPDAGPTLRRLTLNDAEQVYAAIARCRPGGMGTVPQEDVAERPRVTLLGAMQLAAERDEIARLYATDFRDLFERDVPALRAAVSRLGPPQGIVRFFVDRLARVADTLIARKCGPDVAAEASRRAAGGDVPELDRWLRGDGHRRNPGTTADVVAATLFAAMRSDETFAATIGEWLDNARSPTPEPDLRGPLLERVRSVSDGELTSFGRLAASLGDAKAAVWVSQQVASLEADAATPRVLKADGSLPATHRDALLADCRRQGIAMRDDRVIDPVWASLSDEGPLTDLRRWQDTINPPPPRSVAASSVAGLDVSYPDGGRAVAACAVVGREDAGLRWSAVVSRPVRFPYISGYLAFRELPALLWAYRVAQDAGRWPGLAIIDGSGRLHPRQAGVAACFSAVTGEPSIGVTKRHLCGTFDRDELASTGRAAVSMDGETLGVAVASVTGGKPLFVSPGGGIGVDDAACVVTALLTQHRVPEPIYWADRLSHAGVPVN